MIFNFIIESYLKHLLFYFQTFLHTLDSAAVKNIAEKYNITPIQVLLSFVLNQENMIAIPKAAQVKHMKENIECLDIKLSQEDLEILNKEFPAPTRKMPLDIE